MRAAQYTLCDAVARGAETGSHREVIPGLSPAPTPTAPLGSSPAARTGTVRVEQDQGWEEDGIEGAHCHFLFRPWFVAGVREGPGVRAGYSYLGVHGNLGAGGRGCTDRGISAGASRNEKDHNSVEGPQWTTINVPVRDNFAGKYGSIPTMISEDVLALVQLNPPRIELCQVSSMKAGSDDNGPHMDKLYTLLLPPLRDGACPDWAVCAGEIRGTSYSPAGSGRCTAARSRAVTAS